jgi:hypothetical protein
MSADDVTIAFAQLEEVTAKAENYERLKRMLVRYVAEHDRKNPPECHCAWCTESRDFLP